MLDGYIAPLFVLVAAVALLAARWLSYGRHRRKNPWWTTVGIIVGVVALAAVLEFAMGRAPTYKYGPVSLWSGNVNSNQNSQQIADPYTPSHIIHGFGFYALLWLFRKHLSVGSRGALAIGLEAAWEVLENTDMVINRYREATISLDYFGDSILNSTCDIIATGLGFLFARYSPIWIVIAATVAMELIVLYFIRDNLTLNIIMLIYPFKAIKTWQLGGG